MDTILLLSIWLSFLLSFIFSLGGVGAAIALVPVLSTWVNLPLQMVKPIALLVNTLAMTGASVNNIKNERLDWKSGLPLIISSIFLAPAGAYLSQFINVKYLVILFVIFLIFSSTMMLFYKKKNSQEDKPFSSPYLIGVGTLAGLLAGLLGIGGGSIISPLLIAKGYNIKKVTTLTAFVIPFSSLTGFLAYVSMGQSNWLYMISCAGAAFIGGILGTAIMQKWINPKVVKKILAFILIGLAIKMILKVAL